MTRYSNDRMLASIRDAAASYGTDRIGFKRYEDWRRKQVGRPAGLTIIKRFGAWNEAVREAGLTANERNPWLGLPDFTDRQMLDTVRAVALRMNREPSYEAFDHYILASEPTASAIRNRFGRWNDVLDFALVD